MKGFVFLQKNDIGETPNGLLVDGTRLILGTIGRRGPARRRCAPPPKRPSLRTYDLKGKTAHSVDGAGRWWDRWDRA